MTQYPEAPSIARICPIRFQEAQGVTTSTQPDRLTRVVLAIGLFLGITASTSADPPPSYAIEQIVLSTDQAPGSNTVFGDLRAPSINAHRAIAFSDGFGFAIYTTADGATVGPLVRAVGSGDVPPGVVGTFGLVSEPSLNADGVFVFRGFGVEISDRGIYLRLASGDLELVADGSTVPPGSSLPILSSAPGIPLATDGSHVLFSDATATTRGVYRADFDALTGATSLGPPVILGSEFLESPGFESPLGYSLNDVGSAVMVLRRADRTRALYAALPDGSLTVLVAEGDPAPGGALFTSNIGAPSINRGGDVAFQADARSGSAIFIRRAGGSLDKVIDGTVAVPNHPGTTFGSFAFRDVHLADDGTVVFRAAYVLDGLTYQGIYRTRGASLGVVFDQLDGIVVNGQWLSLVVTEFGVPHVLDMSLAPRFANDSFDVAFLQQLPADIPFGKGGIFIAKAPAAPVTSVTVDIKPGAFPNTINLASNGTVPVAVVSTVEFDAATVDPRTVTLAGAPVRRHGNGAPMASLEDANGDGLLDLVVHVEAGSLQIAPGATEAVLRGNTYDGAAIQGTDSIEVIQ